MIKNQNYISPIPFYSSLAEVDSRNDYAFGAIYKNVLYKDENAYLHIPPFVLHTDMPAGSAVDVDAILVDANDPTITYQIPNTQFSIIHDNGYETIVCTGYTTIQGVQLGKHYIALTVYETVPEHVLYSDYVYVTDDIHNYVKLTWQNANNLYIADRVIPFEQNFKPYCYVDSLIGKPIYEYEEESTQRNGYEFIESQISKKSYRFVFIAPEYLCDAIRIMKLCSSKKITRFDMPNYGKEYDLMNMDFDVEWEEQGNLAAATIRFSVDNIASNISGYLPLNGDFNNDYNNDFSNT